jgi:hypothetical protein
MSEIDNLPPEPDDIPLDAKLREYHKAFEQEFSLSADETPVQVARDSLTNLLPNATKALEQILISAESDAVRLNAIKLVFEHTLGKPGTGTTEDEMANLIKGLTAKSSKEGKKS